MASGIVTARVLGPNDRGAFAATQTMAGVAAVVLTLGVTQAVVTDHGSDSDLVGPLLAQVTAVALAGCALFGTLAATHVQPWLDAPAIIGAVAATAGGVASSLASGMAQRRSRMTGEFQAVRLIPMLGSLLLLVTAWFAGTRDVGVWILASGAGVAIPAVGVLVRTLGGLNALHGLRSAVPARSLVLSATIAFPTAVGAQIIYRLDSVIVAMTLPTASIAFYGVATAASLTCSRDFSKSVGCVVAGQRGSESQDLEGPLGIAGVAAGLSGEPCYSQ